MQLGMVGLGRMGSGMVRRLMRAGHECVVYDVSADSVKALEADGATGTGSMKEFVDALAEPKSAWVMVPAAFTQATVEQLAEMMGEGAIIVDGGNSYYRDDVDTAARLAERGIRYVDCGTSGGIFGLERGYCLMVGGPDDAVAHLAPVFEALAPGSDAAPRTPGFTGETTTAERGWLHCGPNGAGHFVKMVHNGIEYGLMAAYAEGFAILNHADAGLHKRSDDAETTPLRDPEDYRYTLNLPDVAEVWRRGSVIASWLLDLTADALSQSPTLADFEGRVSDSGEGRWTVHAAVDEGVPATILSAALYNRFTSRGEADFADKLLSAMRKEFGGHNEKVDPGR